MSDNRKDIPNAKAPNFAERVQEALQTYLGNRGDRLDRGLTIRDLVDANMIKLRNGFLTGGGGSGSPVAGPGTAVEPKPYIPDLAPPPTPSGFKATTSTTSILVETDPPIYTQGHGHGKTIVYGAKYQGPVLPVFSDAVVLTEFTGDVFAFPVDPASQYRLWASWVSVDGEESAAPAGGTNGIAATAGLLDSQHIAELTASKIRSGSISVGQFIQGATYQALTSGWRINGDGTAEFNNAVLRGGIFASYGLIGGIAISAGDIRSTNYDGVATGFLISADGTIDLPGGSVNAKHITVGFGGRNLAASALESFTGSSAPVLRSFAPWMPTGSKTGVYINLPTATAATVADFYNNNYGERYTVTGNKRYEASVYVSSHRWATEIRIAFYDPAGTYITEFVGNSTNVQASGPLSDWPRLGVFAVAPPNAATAMLFTRSRNAVGADPYTFTDLWYFGEASANQTEFSPYSPAGLTQISGSMLRTGTVFAGISISSPVLYGGSGYTSAYAWPVNGGDGFHLSASGLLLGNANIGRYVQIDSNGNIQTPGFNIINGVMTVNQANVISTLNLRGESITVPRGATATNTVVIGGLALLLTLPTENYGTGAVAVFVSTAMAQGVDSDGDGQQVGVYPSLTLTRNGVAILDIGTSFSGCIVDYPGGVAQYQLFASARAHSVSPATVSTRSLIAIGCQR